MKSEVIRTRFAPSPTGDLHVGGARTALFNFLLAKKSGGKFVLRVEDTDEKRSLQQYAIDQYNDLLWLGIVPDESPFSFPKCGSYGPYQQKFRLDIYSRYLKLLLSMKKAYYCFCSKQDIEKEREIYVKRESRLDYKYSRKCVSLSDNDVKLKLESNEKYSIRFFVDRDKNYNFDDLIRGSVSFSGNDVEDFVICRENGIPLLNFAVVIDDHLMKISHVMRAEEHLTNTAKQLALYDAFGWTPPVYLHLSIILNDKKKKISKRDNEGKFQIIKSLREMGYLPEGIVNYLLFLGWNPKSTNNEFFSVKEAIKTFEVGGLNHRSPIFSIDKMNWFNSHWIKKITKRKFNDIAWRYLKNAFSLEDKSRLKSVKIAELFREQINCFSDLPELCKFFFEDFTQRVDLSSESRLLISKFFSQLFSLKEWNASSIKKTLIINIEELEKSQKKEFLRMLRKIVTGVGSGPEISRIISLIGKRELKNRISKNI